MRTGRAWTIHRTDAGRGRCRESLGEVKCSAATPADNSPSMRGPFFSWPPMRFTVRQKMESAMRMIAMLVAVCGMLTYGPARADIVPPFKGNDTGGIIAYELAMQSDVKLL